MIINRPGFKAWSWKPGRYFFHVVWDDKRGIEVRMWRKRKPKNKR